MKSLLKNLFFVPLFLLVQAPLCADELEVVAPQGSITQTLMMVGVAVFFFYFILWRPEKKRRQEVEDQRSRMKKGDRVTAMGIVGFVDKIKEKTVILKMVDGSKIEFIKGAISEVETVSNSQEEALSTQASVST